VWLTDITEHPTSEGQPYCCAIHDVFSYRIVGCSIAEPDDRGSGHSRPGVSGRPSSTRGTVVVHSDRGSQIPLSEVPGRAEGQQLDRVDVTGLLDR